VTGTPNELAAEAARQAPPRAGRRARGDPAEDRRKPSRQRGPRRCGQDRQRPARDPQRRDRRRRVDRSEGPAPASRPWPPTSPRRATATRSAEDIAAALESLGASINAGASPDGSIFSVTAPAANLDAVGTILADVIRNASYPQAEFDLERKRMTDGLRVALNNPGAIAAMVAQPLLYGTAPYGGQAGGTMKSLAAITRDDLVAYRRVWWHPANMSVVVTGGIEPAAGAALAKRLFGDWKPEGRAPALPKSRAGTALPPRTIVVDLPGAGQAAVLAAVRGVSRADADYSSLLLANSVLGVGSNGRLFNEVRSKRALSYGAYSSMPARADTALLSASAQTKNETATEVAEIFLNEFKRLGAEPITPDALAKRRAFLEGAYGRQQETGGGYGAIVAGLILQGLQPADALDYAARLGAVTPEAANAIAAKNVTPENASLIVVGDSAKFIDKLRTLRPDLVVIPASKLDLESPTLGADPR
jgi:zinc protease